MNYHLRIELATCCDTPAQLMRKVNTKLKPLHLFAEWEGSQDQCYAHIQFYDFDLWKAILNTVAKAKTQCGCSCLNGDSGSMGFIMLDTHISNETAHCRHELFQQHRSIGSYLYNTRTMIHYLNGEWILKEENK
jgi:hypothetical protein